MALLDMVQNAAAQLGLRQPQAVVGSTDLTTQILLRFAQQEGKELARYHDWQNLIVQRTFTSLNQVIQTGAIPADYDRLMYNVEIWNRSTNQRYSGPTPQRDWAQMMAGFVGGIPGFWRLIGNQLNLFAAPDAGQTIAFEYITKNWCQSNAAVGQALWKADTDVALLSEDLMTLGMIWRYRASRGFPQYAEDMSTYEREKEKAASRDRGTGRIHGANNGGWPPGPFFNGTIDG